MCIRDSPMTDQELVELAFTMLERSYVPYSHFPVGAALELSLIHIFRRLAPLSLGLIIT